MTGKQYSQENLIQLFNETPMEPIGTGDRYVVFSDLHLGNGGRTDDFIHNSSLFLTVLRDYYLSEGFKLILNGDVEELQRFSPESIRRRWAQAFDLFGEFGRETACIRLVGNHDMLLALDPQHSAEVREAIRLKHHGNDLFIFHGHQTAKAYEEPNLWIYLTLRYLANPLRIRNRSVAHDSTKQFRTERRVYRFASQTKILAIIGHTHRPLFESMSKLDSIKFRIEQLCRSYPEASRAQREEIEQLVRKYREDLESFGKRRKGHESSSLYNADLVVPCMFNSGCVIGQRGMTCLEIRDDDIALVYWFDRDRSRKYLHYDTYSADQLGDTDFFRVVIKRDSLDYIFTRILLLSGSARTPVP